MTDFTLIDECRSRCLCDVGAAGLIAAVAVDAAGGEGLIIADRARLGDQTATFDWSTPEAPHEQLGPLPGRYQLGVQCVPLRCCRPTKTGAPCRTPVVHPGGRCHHHRGAEVNQTTSK